MHKAIVYSNNKKSSERWKIKVILVLLPENEKKGEVPGHSMNIRKFGHQRNLHLMKSGHMYCTNMSDSYHLRFNERNW